MRRKSISITVFVLVALCLSAPLSAAPGTAAEASRSWLVGLVKELSRSLQDLVNAWVPWSNREGAGSRERPLSADEAPSPRVPEETPNTGWVDKEGCSLDPLGRPTPPGCGGG